MRLSQWWRPCLLHALLGVAGPAAIVAGDVPCGTVTIGLDPSQAGNSAGSYLGRSVGQSFLAPNTLMQSLTVWRVPSQAGDVIGMHLFVTEADSSGSPFLDRIVLDGPTVVNPGGDGVNPTPFSWHFDPPVNLPRVGAYAFFLALDPCLGYFDVLGTAEGAGLYPDGIVLLSGRTAGCDLTGDYADEFPLADLIFRIEFCSDAPTSAKSETWGRLKQIYR